MRVGVSVSKWGGGLMITAPIWTPGRDDLAITFYRTAGTTIHEEYMCIFTDAYINGSKDGFLIGIITIPTHLEVRTRRTYVQHTMNQIYQ
jgi:hypothetical protein